ncbi:MAG: TVP38/TMEM64 family protein [Leptolyngbyaceae cyanobacterium SM2_5_2]|nr:TVP38/TMEM64 family protein [Leptolyngbyaceae cyanobacterium SM2_5_2]
MAKSRFTLLRFLQIWLLLALGLGLALAAHLAWRQMAVFRHLSTALVWVQQQGTVGVMAFIALYNLATVLMIPASLLTLGGGVLYGAVWGSIYGLLAATLGAILAFLIGRYCARAWVYRQMQRYPYFRAIDACVAQAGFKIVLLTRLSPVLPYNLLNYGFGLTRVSLKDYGLGSLGMIPGTIMYAYLGSLTGDLAVLANPLTLSHTIPGELHLLGGLATVALTLLLSRLARQALHHTTSKTP